VKLVVDTGVFSAALSRRRRPSFERHVNTLAGHQLFLSVVTVAELRFGAMVAEWGQPRRAQLEVAIATATVVPVTDAFITRLATTRTMCRRIGHPLWEPIHSNDLWVAVTALHLQSPLVTADHVFDDVPDLSVLPSTGT
jgi:predicted nucleic acid-binding protein